MKRAKGLLPDGPAYFASLDGESWLGVSRRVEVEDEPAVRKLFTPVQKDGKETFHITMDTRYLLQTCKALVIECL